MNFGYNNGFVQLDDDPKKFLANEKNVSQFGHFFLLNQICFYFIFFFLEGEKLFARYKCKKKTICLAILLLFCKAEFTFEAANQRKKKCHWLKCCASRGCR